MTTLRRGAAAVTRTFVLVLASAFLVGCPADSTDPSTETDATVAEVALSAPQTTIEAGATVQLGASSTNAAGVDLGARTYTWTSSAAGVATVGANGLVTGVAPGSATIAAIESTSGIGGTITLTVIPAPVHSVTVAPPTASVVAGETRPLSVVLKDSRGAVLTGRAVEWTSSDPATASVDGNGLVTAHVAGGPVAITATAEGKSGSAQITVTPIPVAAVLVTPPTSTLIEGDTWLLTATLTAADGDTLTDRVVVWSSADTLVATVDQTGLVTAKVAGGPITVSASAEGVSGTAQVTVNPMPVASIEITPASATLVLGETVALDVVARASNGDTLTGRPIAWSSADSSIASVDASGLVTSQAVGGPVAVIASVEGRVDTALVSVTPVPVAGVLVAPTSVTLEQGSSMQINAFAVSADGDTLTGRAVTWSSADTTLASVDATGSVIAVGVGGPVAITASVEGASASAAVTVVPVPVAQVALSYATADVLAGDSLLLGAVALAADGDTLSGRAIAWTSRNAAVASVDANGMVRAHALGVVWVVAEAEGVADSARITVSSVPVSDVIVDPASVVLELGQTAQLVAFARAASGDTLTDRAVTWTSADTSIATVDGAGLVVAAGIGGPVVITAQVEGVSGTADVTVTAVPVAGIELAASATDLFPRDTLHLRAYPVAANGDTLAERAVAWTSRDASIVSVDANGVATAHAEGAAWLVASSEAAADSLRITVLPLPVASVTVDPAAASLVDGDTLRLNAIALSEHGDTLAGRLVSWTTSDSTVATVDADGLVTAIGVGGPVTVTASSELVEGSAQITVTAAPLGSIAIDADSVALFVGDSARLAASAYGTTGDTLSDVAIVWTSRDGAVASVDSTGLVTALGAGETWVVASSGAFSDSTAVAVSVVPVASIGFAPGSPATVVGDTVRLHAYPLSAAGDTLAERAVAWSSRDTTVASIGADGLVTGHAPGSVWMVALIEGVSDSAQVTVAPAPAALLVVAPDSVDAYIGASVALAATVTDTNGEPMAVTPTWLSLDPAVATVDSLGAVTALGIGSARIVAAFETLADSALVSVASPITRIAITPDSVTLTTLGASQAYSAVAYDTADAPMSGVVFAWQSLNPLVATLDPATGETTTATAVDAGVTEIRASALGVSAEVTLRVGQFPATIDVAPDTVTLTVNGRVTLVADVRDGSGATIEEAIPVWRASNGNVVVDSLSGLVSGAVLGTSFVWAELDGVTSDSVAITVSNVAPPTLSFGARSFAVGRDASVSMPIYLSTAPAQDVVVLLTSADTLYAEFEPARVVFSAGQTQANASLRGVQVGALNVWALDSAGTYGGDTVRVEVQNVAELNFPDGIAAYQTYTPAMHVGETYPAELRLSDPAPAGGLYFTISASGVQPSPSTIYVPQGQLVAVFDVTGAAAGSASFSASANGTMTATRILEILPAELRFNQQSGETGAFVIGRGQSGPVGNTLTLTTPVRLREELDVDLAWSDAGVASGITSTRLSTQGTNSYNADVEWIPLEALETGVTTITASAPGWTDAVATVLVTTPMVVLYSGQGSRDLVSVNTTDGVFQINATSTDSLGTPHFVIGDQPFTVWSGDTTIVRVLTTDTIIHAGSQNTSNLRLEPVGPGEVWIHAGGAGLLTDSIRVVATAPKIAATYENWAAPGYLSGGPRVTIPRPPAPVLMRFESSDTMVAALDSAFNSNGSVDVYIRSRMAGTAQVVVTAPGYLPDTVEVVSAPARAWGQLAPTVVNFGSTNMTVSVRDTMNFLYALDSTTISIEVLDTTVVRADSMWRTGEPGRSLAFTVGLAAVGVGTTDIVITAPAARPDTVTITVTGALLSATGSGDQLGRYQTTDRPGGVPPVEIMLPGERTVPVVLHVSQRHPELLEVLEDSIIVPAGVTRVRADWQSFGVTGADTVTFSADGYADVVVELSVIESRIMPGSFSAGVLRTTMPPVDVQLQLGAVGLGNSPGATTVPVTIYVESTDSSVLVPDSGVVRFAPGEWYLPLPVRLVGPGQARLIYRDSAGIYASDSSNVATVIAPGITVGSSWGGYPNGNGNLQLGMLQQNGTTSSFTDVKVKVPDPVVGEPLVITLSSSDTSLLVVPATAVIPVGATEVAITVFAQDTIGSVAVFATADGFQQGRVDVDVTRPRLRVTSNGSVTMPGDTAARGYVQIETTNEGGYDQPTSVDLVLTVTSSDPSVVEVLQGEIVIPAGSGYLYQPMLRYVGPGSATITVADPRSGFIDYGAQSVVVTVSP